MDRYTDHCDRYSDSDKSSSLLEDWLNTTPPRLSISYQYVRVP